MTSLQALQSQSSLNPSSASIEKNSVLHTDVSSISTTLRTSSTSTIPSTLPILTSLTILILLSILFTLDANASTGMTEFNTISKFIKDNLSGTLGKSAALGALSVGLVSGMTNFRWAIVGPCAGVIGLITIAPKIIDTAFGLVI